MQGNFELNFGSYYIQISVINYRYSQKANNLTKHS